MKKLTATKSDCSVCLFCVSFACFAMQVPILCSLANAAFRRYAHKGDLHNMLCSLGKFQEAS